MTIFDKHNQPLADRAVLREHIELALEVTGPPPLEMALMYRLVKRLFDPVLIGAGEIPDRPCLFVGNHSLFALDGWVLGPVMYREGGRFLRGLGDRFLFTSPRLARQLLRRGAVMGHPEVCSALMEAGRDLIVFPGGALEAVKPARLAYELQWKERLGFVRLAAKHGYTIMPFGMVGPDEFYDHLLEGQDLPESALGRVLRSFGVLTDDTRTDLLPPLPVGALGTALPKPQRCFIGLGEAVDLSHLRGKRLGRRQLEALRDRVAEQVETQLAELLFTRAQRRREDGLLRRILTL